MRVVKKRKVAAVTEEVVEQEPKGPAPRRVLNASTADPAKTLSVDDLVTRVVSLAQAISEKPFYPYQVELASRIVESLLLHDGDVITSLMARQAGKTETLGGICAAIAIIFPYLAKMYPDDWHLNLTDDRGGYRGYRNGVRIGIYAPKLEQASITFERVRKAFDTDTAKSVLQELGLSAAVNNGNQFSLSSGSRILCESASENSKIEGATHHLLVAEEAQDISDMKMKKSLHPMTASTMGTIVKIGTASTHRCDFYDAIRVNRRTELVSGRRNHFFFPYQVCARFNSLYGKYIEQEKGRIGEQSDEFRLSYCGEFIFERGMFVTQDVLLSPTVALTHGDFAEAVLAPNIPFHIHPKFRRYSLVAGIDWGSSNDSTVLTLIAVDWANPVETGTNYNQSGNAVGFTLYRKHVLGWVEFQGDNYEQQFGQIVSILEKVPGLAKITTDSNTCGKPIYDRLSAYFTGSGVDVEPFNFQPRVKSDGYKMFYNDLWAGRITIPAGEKTRKTKEYARFVGQMLDLKKDYKAGIMQVAHPDEKGAHDDYPDAVMLACWGASNPSMSGKVRMSERNSLLFN